ncbi:MAG: HDOD domain-containing protein [Methylosarcina sp.]
MENSILKILSKIDTSSLPVVPQVLLDLIRASQHNEVSFKELTKIIGQDASLSSKVLATANSSFYRQWGEVTDLNRVITVLGLNTVRTIAITRTVQQFFSQIPPNHYTFLEMIWYRSLICAHLACHIATLTAYEFPDEAYLTGLIHRLGQIVLLKCFPKEYPIFLAKHFDGQQSSLERKSFGATHQEVAGHLIESWKIQADLSDAVLYQSHSIEAITDRGQLIKIVNLASQLSIMDSKNKPQILRLADELFGLNQPLVEEMLKDAKSFTEKLALNLDISIANPNGSRIKSLTSQAQRNKVQKNVAEYIQDIALTSAIKQEFELSPAHTHLISIIQRDMSVLFGFQITAVFLFRQEINSLVGTLGFVEENSPSPSITINIKQDQSLLVKALLNRQILHTFDTTKANLTDLVDHQINRWLATEGMLLIPLWANGQAAGVIVSGLNQSEIKTIDLKVRFITLFAKEAALALLQDKASSKPDQQTLLDGIRENYHLLARKLVHEVTNPLSIINNYLHLLRRKLGEDNSAEIRIIQEEIDRVGNLILKLPDIMEIPAEEEKRLVDINSVIIDLIKLFQTGIFITHDIHTVLKLDSILPEISSSRYKLKQILTNLIKNSVEAMPTGGTITISTKDHVKFRTKHYIEILVHDNGPGLPRIIRENLFAPLIGTKGKGHSGLGLTICKNLVDELGGTIQCDSSSSHGTTFRILLPKETW